MKQTVVEQLKNEFFSYAEPFPYFSEEDKWVITENDFMALVDRLKTIEKQSIIDAYWYGEDEYYSDIDTIKAAKAEQYYNETYRQHESMD